MRIVELAKLTGASLKAIRLYEAKGLLPLVARDGSYRRYEHRHLEQACCAAAGQSAE
ncbi:MerR family DNA-binding transcriptional regulator [Salinispirillum sp. LH 10-3-1]|uniref:MerR family DNA-binding transcriptional regulator n=1 Tax=Salinispirillum sp. LH 10-3-1 TaxID=2952525 RepID=A0AB38YIK2_9GAMM